MIRIKMNSSYYPDWYTDKDFGKESVDKRGYTFYYISAKQMPSYLWKLFRTFDASMNECAISYFKQHPCNIEPKSIKITVDNSIRHISVKYTIKPTADNIDEVRKLVLILIIGYLIGQTTLQNLSYVILW